MAEGPDRADAVDAEGRGQLQWKDWAAKVSVVEQGVVQGMALVGRPKRPDGFS